MILIFCSISANGQSVHQRISEMDVDYKIRASEDPHFDQFLHALEQQKELSKRASLESKARKIREQNQEEQARLQYIKEKQYQLKIQERTDQRNMNKYFEAQKEIAKAEEKQRKKFVAKKREEARLQADYKRKLIARMEARLSRLPASYGIEKRARIPKGKRETLYKKILEQNEAKQRAQRSRR